MKAKFAWTLIAVTNSTLICATASAQTTATPPPSDDAKVEEIVVTAQRRSERLQDVPVSVTALSGEALAKQRITEAGDLGNVVPNLRAISTVGDTTPIFALRGVSLSDYSLNQSSPVATYEDEVYKGNFALLGVALFDLERVEVLRGPQGTLYGKNTTGGAVNLIARKPEFKPEATLAIGYGNYNHVDVNGTAQAPITDTLAVRAAFTYTRADGWFRNLSPGQGDLNALDEYAARLSLRYVPNDRLDFVLRLSTSLQNPTNYGILAQPGPAGIGGGVYAALNALDPVLNPRTDDFRAGLGDRQLRSDFTPRRHNRTYAASLVSTYKVNDRLSLISISSFDRGTLLNEEDTDGSDLKALSILYNDHVTQVTQDVRLTSNNLGSFNFTIGGFYGHEQVFNSTNLRAYQDIDFNLDGVLNFQDCLTAGPPAGCQMQNRFDQRRERWAGYFDGSYLLGGGFKLRGGFRYSYDSGRQYNIRSLLVGSDNVVLANLIPGDPVNLDATASQRFANGNLSGKVGIDYGVEGKLLYLNYSRGYRASSFAAQAFFAPSELTVARPEIVDAVEGGFKLDLFGRRLRLNGAGFWYGYQDQQFIDVNPDGTQRLLNLPRSRIVGGEIEVVGRPTRHLTLTASAGLLDTLIEQGIVQGVSVTGNRLPFAPTLTLSYAADWNVASGSWGKLTSRIDGSYVTAQEYDALNNPDLHQGGYNILGARLGYRTANDRFGAALWVKNLTDAYYFTSRIAISSIGFNYNHLGAPRTFGLVLDARF